MQIHLPYSMHYVLLNTTKCITFKLHQKFQYIIFFFCMHMVVDKRLTVQTVNAFYTHSNLPVKQKLIYVNPMKLHGHSSALSSSSGIFQHVILWLSAFYHITAWAWGLSYIIIWLHILSSELFLFVTHYSLVLPFTERNQCNFLANVGTIAYCLDVQIQK